LKLISEEKEEVVYKFNLSMLQRMTRFSISVTLMFLLT